MKQSPAKTKPQVPFGKLRASSRQAFGPLRSGLVRSLVGNTRGAEIAETAMIMPLLFMMVMAIFWMGQAFRIYGTLGHAARARGSRGGCASLHHVRSGRHRPGPDCPDRSPECAHSGELKRSTTCSQHAMDASHTLPMPHRRRHLYGRSLGSRAMVSVSNMCVQENVQLSNPSDPNSGGGMGTCGISVSMRYQYPYSFKIPFTAIDLGNIKLPGQAQMRAETQ